MEVFIKVIRGLCFLFFSVAASAVAEEESWMQGEVDPEQHPSVRSEVYSANCAVCHGDRLEGTTQGPALFGNELINGDSVGEIIRSIQEGFPAENMPAWAPVLSEQEIKQLAIYLSEIRSNMTYETFNYDSVFVIPEEPIVTEEVSIVLETFVSGLDPLPFSIEPLPDGQILLTERKRGISLISSEGVQSDYIIGAPRAYGSSGIFRSVKQEYGHGWMMDVNIHPEYEDNGWIYIQYGDRCEGCNQFSLNSKSPVSMNRLIRGRVKEGEWTDEEVIWEADKAHYGPVPDLAGGGRTTFDESGHVYISVGMQGLDNHKGVQNLSVPWGKIHRVKDDGKIPKDNPFYYKDSALRTVWTYGHRSPQGLEYRKETGEVWSTEMGPRGGDELNHLEPGKNYGWPLYSKGIDYDGTAVEYGKDLGIEFDLEDIKQPAYDFTPSPAVSSFVFYSGEAFPQWKDNLIMGSLKARTLYRFVLEGDRVVHTEKLITDLARFRDIELDSQGNILLLLEHNSGSKIVRLKPAI